MKISKADLQKALEIVKPGLASTEIIEQSTSFAFVDGRAVTYNDEISISHPIAHLKIEGAVKAEALYQLLDKITTKEIEIESSDKQITLKAGKGRAGLILQQEVTLPLEKIDNKGWHDLPEGFVDAIKFVAFCCSKDTTSPVLTCIHITENGRVEACDNYRAVWYQVDSLPVPTFLLPNSSAQYLIKYPITKIKTGKGWVHFKTDVGTIFSCRIFECVYVDTIELYNLKKPATLRFPKATIEILNRARVFATQDQALVDEEVELKIVGNKLHIRGESAAGWFEEVANIQHKGEPITLMVNPSFLVDIIKKMMHCNVTKDKMQFQGENWEHIIALT